MIANGTFLICGTYSDFWLEHMNDNISKREKGKNIFDSELVGKFHQNFHKTLIGARTVVEARMGRALWKTREISLLVSDSYGRKLLNIKAV